MEMFQQIVVDTIRSRCTGFGLRDWPPKISQSEGFSVDFSVIWGEVNFHHLFLLLYGLECSTVVGGGVICECRSMLVSNIFELCDGSTILSIQILRRTVTVALTHMIFHDFEDNYSSLINDSINCRNCTFSQLGRHRNLERLFWGTDTWTLDPNMWHFTKLKKINLA